MEQPTTEVAPKVSVLTKITDRLFGRKYYINIINLVGTGKCEASCFIFPTLEMAISHKESLKFNRSYQYVETISFRTKKQYKSTWRSI